MIRRFTPSAALMLALGLLLLALGYWRAWLPHSSAALTLLGVDLPEFVKFVPEVRSGQIALRREVFFQPLLALTGGMLLLATLRQPPLPGWMRLALAALVIPAALSMLPPAWTPALLRTPEFRTQVWYILLLLLGVALSPLLQRFLPDRVRGLLFVGLALLPLPALLAYVRLQPALAVLYGQAPALGAGFYLTAVGALLLGLGGGLLILRPGPARRRA